MTANITPHITLTIIVVTNEVDRVAALAAALAVALLVDHPAVIIRMMIKPVIDPLGPVMTTTLVTITSLLIHQPSNTTAN